MTFSGFLSLLMLMTAGTVTPGPNNALLTASGMNFGYRRSLPHMLGVGLGLSTMIFLIALGLGAVYLKFPIISQILQIVAILVLLWLAYKIATAPVDKLEKAQKEPKPWRFWQAFWFQWINPKAWLICIAVSGQYAGGEQPLMSALWILIAAMFASVVSTNLWTGFGLAMARFLNTPMKRRVFNYVLAGLIVLSVFMLLGDHNAPI